MSEIDLKSQEKGDLIKGPFGVSSLLVSNQTSNNFFETPCISITHLGHNFSSPDSFEADFQLFEFS